MHGAIVLLAVLVVVGLLLLYFDRRKPHRPDKSDPSDASDRSDKPEPVCCGLHAVCVRILHLRRKGRRSRVD